MATISVSLPSDGQTIDASDYNTPVTTIVNAINGNLDNDNIKTGAGISGAKLADASLDLGAKASTWDGWIAVSDSWSYASATTITVPTDATTKYSVGDKVKFTNTTLKYFTVTAVAATTLTLLGQGGATVANTAISGISYSHSRTPLGVTGGGVTNPYCFRAYNSVSVTLTDATNVKITLGAEAYDYNSNFNTTTSTYTAPVAGVYHFSAKVKISSGVSTGLVFTTFLYVNGANAYEGGLIAPGNFAATIFSADILLAANDTVELYAQQDSAGNEATETGDSATYFSGHLVHAT